MEWISQEFDESWIHACLSILEAALQTDERKDESYPKEECVEDVERLRKAPVVARVSARVL